MTYFSCAGRWPTLCWRWWDACPGLPASTSLYIVSFTATQDPDEAITPLPDFWAVFLDLRTQRNHMWIQNYLNTIIFIPSNTKRNNVIIYINEFTIIYLELTSLLLQTMVLLEGQSAIPTPFCVEQTCHQCSLSWTYKTHDEFVDSYISLCTRKW